MTYGAAQWGVPGACPAGPCCGLKVTVKRHAYPDGRRIEAFTLRTRTMTKLPGAICRTKPSALWVALFLCLPMAAHAQSALLDEEWLLQCEVDAANKARGDAQLKILLGACKKQAVPKMCRGLSDSDGPSRTRSGAAADKPSQAFVFPVPKDGESFEQFKERLAKEERENAKKPQQYRFLEPIVPEPVGSSLAKCVESCASANAFKRRYGECAKG